MEANIFFLFTQKHHK